MAQQGRQTQAVMNRTIRAIADVIKNHGTEVIKEDGKPRVTRIQRYLKSDFNIDITIPTVYKYLKKDMESISQIEIDGVKSYILKGLKDVVADALDISQADPDNSVRLKTMNTYSRLLGVQAKIIAEFDKLQMNKDVEDRPIYNIVFGKPSSIERICPKCKHGWLDVGDSKDKRFKIIKDCKAQKVFDDFIRNEEDEEPTDV